MRLPQYSIRCLPGCAEPVDMTDNSWGRAGRRTKWSLRYFDRHVTVALSQIA
jgi:hypothetical protein